MDRFDGNDAGNALFGVSPGMVGLRARVRDFIDREVIPHESPALAHDVAALDDIAVPLRAAARTAGVWGPRLPREHGGLDLNWRDSQVFLEEAGRSPLGPIAVHCAPPDGPNIGAIATLGTPAQRSTWLLPLIDQRVRSCFAMTEPPPGAGSDPAMLRTTATRRGDGWVLSGRKWFISGAEGAAVAIVMARTDEGPTFFLVDTANPGWRHVRTIPTSDGFQIGGHGEIELADCVVPGDAVLGEVGRGFAYAQDRLEPARLAHCMRLLGRAVRALECAEAHAVSRRSFGSRLADHQLVQGLIADSHIDLAAARLMTGQVAARLDAGLDVKQSSAMAKVFVSEAIGRIVDRATQVCGAAGVSHDLPLARIAEEVRAFRIYDGASEVHRAAIARRVLRARAPGGTTTGT